MTPFELDLANFAGAGYFYKRKPANQIPIAQTSALLAGGLGGRALQGGFEARAYEYAGKIVISFAGTYFPGNGLLGEIEENGLSDAATASIRDWLSNVNLGVGGLDTQLVEATRFYEDVKKANPGRDIVFTGHSLGGGLAGIMGLYERGQALPFARSCRRFPRS